MWVNHETRLVGATFFTGHAGGSVVAGTNRDRMSVDSLIGLRHLLRCATTVAESS
jgi:hypothetical protein